MLIFASMTDARNAIMDYPTSALPAYLRDRYRALRGSPSPMQQIAQLGEFIYANRAAIDDEGRALGCGLIAHANLNGWNPQYLGTDNRGDRIVQALRRDLGEQNPVDGASWPEPSTDPLAREALFIQPPA